MCAARHVAEALQATSGPAAGWPVRGSYSSPSGSVSDSFVRGVGVAHDVGPQMHWPNSDTRFEAGGAHALMSVLVDEAKVLTAANR
jgi:hypothetical protein